MDTTELIKNALDWADKRLTLQDQNLTETQRTYISFALSQNLVENFALSGVVATLPQDPIVLARYMHDAYEMLAKNNDWNTQENCKVDFSDLPIGNKNTMILLAGKLILDFGGNYLTVHTHQDEINPNDLDVTYESIKI